MNDNKTLVNLQLASLMALAALPSRHGRKHKNTARPNECTKRYHEESKKRRKRAAASRKRNRRH